MDAIIFSGFRPSNKFPGANCIPGICHTREFYGFLGANGAPTIGPLAASVVEVGRISNL